jgi:hypothetical protein
MAVLVPSPSGLSGTVHSVQGCRSSPTVAESHYTSSETIPQLLCCHPFKVVQSLILVVAHPTYVADAHLQKLYQSAKRTNPYPSFHNPVQFFLSCMSLIGPERYFPVGVDLSSFARTFPFAFSCSPKTPRKPDLIPVCTSINAFAKSPRP